MKLLGRGAVVEFPLPPDEEGGGAEKVNQHLVVPLNRTQHKPGFPAQMPVPPKTPNPQPQPDLNLNP